MIKNLHTVYVASQELFSGNTCCTRILTLLVELHMKSIMLIKLSS